MKENAVDAGGANDHRIRGGLALHGYDAASKVLFRTRNPSKDNVAERILAYFSDKPNGEAEFVEALAYIRYGAPRCGDCRADHGKTSGPKVFLPCA
jgi:hypothetical protein